MQITYSYVSDLPFKNFCKFAKQTETIKNRSWLWLSIVWGIHKLTRYQPGVKNFLPNFSLQNKRKRLRVQPERADIIHSHSEIKEIFDPENSPFYWLGAQKYIEEPWFLIPCHRCEKSARESSNSQPLIPQSDNIHARTHDTCVD